MTSSNGKIFRVTTGNSPVTGEFPAQRPVTRSFDVFFDLDPNERLRKQSWGWWFETPSCSLWRHRNDCMSILNSYSSGLPHGSDRNSRIAPMHYIDVIMTTMASQITSLTVAYSTVYSDADQRKHQSSASLAFVRGIHRGPVNSPHKWPVTRKMFPFDDVIMSKRSAIKFQRCPVKCHNRDDISITAVEIAVSCQDFSIPVFPG